MRGPMLLLIPAVLMAQRPALPPIQAFDRELKKNRFGTWLVLEDEGAAWGEVARAALEEDPLVMLNLPLKVVAGGKKPDALAAVLRERYGWPKGAHWALVDGKGQALAEGSETPTSAALARASEQAGIHTRAQELESFLRHHPERMDARAALIQEHIEVASRRTRKAMGMAESKPATPSDSTPVKQLEPEVDLKIWAPAAQQLDTMLREVDGFLSGPVGIRFSFHLRVSVAERSPSMVAVLNRHKGTLEEALRRQPEGFETWHVWVSASQKCGGWPLRPLLASIQALPGTPPDQWPPMGIVEEYLKDAKSRGEWTRIREILEPRWADLRETLLDGRAEFRKDAFSWNWVLSPLLEAQVSQGDIGAADQVLNEAAEVLDWAGLGEKARDLATRLKRPDLAARWGTLTPKGR